MGLVFVLFILEFDAFLAWKFVFLLDLIYDRKKSFLKRFFVI
jgi:hypothetical protein